MRYLPYILDGLDPLRHLALENSLLDRMPATDPLLLFYVNSPSVIIGRNQNPWREIAASSTVPWFRRASGGGAVYHDEGNLNWSFIVPKDEHDQDAELSLIARGISLCGAPVSPGERGGIFCDPSTGHGGKKISGTARRFGRASVIHHGTVLVSTDMESLRSSLGGMLTFDDRGIASVPAKPVNFADLVPGVSVADMMESIALSVSSLKLSPLPSDLIDPSRLASEEKLLGSADWKFGTTPPFLVKLEAGNIRLSISIKAGLVDTITVFSPDEERVATPSIRDGVAGFTGTPFSYILGQEIESVIHQFCNKEHSPWVSDRSMW